MKIVERDWTTKAGLRAVCLFVHDSHRCGYVAVPEGHPLFGVKYSEPAPCLKDLWAKVKEGPIGDRGVISVLFATEQSDNAPQPDIVFDVHGSLTYSDKGGDYPVEAEAVWWFGFDCAHSGDVTKYCPDGGVFRTEDYVIEQCEKLAEQLAAVQPEEVTP